MTIPEAARRVCVSEDTIRRYIRQGHLKRHLGRVSEGELVEVEAAARKRAAASRFKENSA
ncbi:helix-turn-helix domain-containing protein [Microbacterium sp.]|uniref:helix-turn-helix domain-containing protein n=1 Tax=Microbacterium sp. TaxID=51671 RepID=UPI003C75556B